MNGISSTHSAPGFRTDTMATNRTRSQVEASTMIDQSVVQSAPAIEPRVLNDQMQKKLDRILQAIKLPDTEIDRSFHEETHQFVYKVKDKTTGDVLRQFPEEKMLEAATKLIELTGMMVDERM